jgi:putative endonuclease
MWNPLRRTRDAAGSTREKGAAGEAYAVRFLRGQGFRILARNYRCRLGEIDVVAREGDVLCFVEVKTRGGDLFGTPLEAVTAHKQGQILKAAQDYLIRHRHAECACRFDVVSVRVSPEGAYSATLTRDAFRV